MAAPGWQRSGASETLDTFSNRASVTLPQYARRAGVEGTLAQGIRRCGLRQSWYIWLAQTHLQHLLTAVALNVVRLGAFIALVKHLVVRPL